MNKQLTIQEKYSRYWPAIAIISMCLAVIFFIFYQSVENVLWEGYLRLASFGFFALGLLSLFKIKDGQVEISVSIEEEVIKSDYKVRDQVIHTEEWPKTDIFKLKIDEMPNKSLYNDIMKSDKCIRFCRNDEESWIYFNKLKNRVIPLSSKNANLLYEFLKESTHS